MMHGLEPLRCPPAVPQLEGAVQAGEGRVRAQAAELEATKARARELEAQLEAAQVSLLALAWPQCMHAVPPKCP